MRSAFVLTAMLALAGACGDPAINGNGGATGTGGSGGGGPVTPPRTDGGFLPPTTLPDSGAPPRGGAGGAMGTGGSAGTPGAGGSAGTPGAGDMTCASTSAKATPVPVDLFIMLDKSGSMQGAKWDAAKAALTSFVQSPTTAGMSVGLGVFPLLEPGGFLGIMLSRCTVADYAKPLVGVDVLPGASQRIVDALAMTTVYGGTPTRPALEGSIQYARTWEMTKGRRIAIALVTDGIPNDCMSTVDNVAALARTAAMGGIFTFVVGVGPMLDSLNMVAVAGGTKAAILVDNGNADQFIAALKMIQTQASRLACQFAIPPSSMGMLDPNKVNVTFSPTGNPAMASTLPRVASRDQCGPMGGWYYDNPTMPTAVNLCDASCQLANSSPMGEVSLQFGCKTKVIE
jgi:von Willebrand factor type A domain